MKVAIIGTGTMGKELVQFFSQSPHIETIIWKGNSQKKTEIAFNEIKRNFKKLCKRKKINTSENELFIKKIIPIISYPEIQNIDFLIETITEDKLKKEDVYKNINNIVDESTIVCSNTSSLSITQLASHINKPERVIGLHFFNPVSLMSLTEVIVGEYTSQETIDSTYVLIKNLNKKPVLVNEAPGFIVNRMLIPMINEGITILAEGVASANEIDQAMRYGANHPIGPLALSDLIGNDVVLAIMDTLLSETGDPKYRAHPQLRKMVRANKLGRKTKSGFFEYK